MTYRPNENCPAPYNKVPVIPKPPAVPVRLIIISPTGTSERNPYDLNHGSTTVTVEAVDANGNPVSGVTIYWEELNQNSNSFVSHGTVTPSSEVTGANGEVTFTVSAADNSNQKYQVIFYTTSPKLQSPSVWFKNH